jgi:hypothetical protein
MLWTYSENGDYFKTLSSFRSIVPMPFVHQQTHVGVSVINDS